MRYLIGIFAVLGVQGCGQTSPEEIKSRALHRSDFDRIQVSTQSVEGYWQSGCILDDGDNGFYLKTSLYLFQGSVMKKLSVYQDPSCITNPSWDRVYFGSYTLNLDEFRQRYDRMSVIPRSVLHAGLLNLGDRYCHAVQPFQVDQEQVFTPISQCNELSEQISKLDAYGDRTGTRELFLESLKLTRGVPGSERTE